MEEAKDKDTRYFIDIDLDTTKVVQWDSGDRHKLIKEDLPKNRVRIFITKGQYNKLPRA